MTENQHHGLEAYHQNSYEELGQKKETSPRDAERLEKTLSLRDFFTPLCYMAAETIKKVPQEVIQKEAVEFLRGIGETEYNNKAFDQGFAMIRESDDPSDVRSLAKHFFAQYVHVKNFDGEDVNKIILERRKTRAREFYAEFVDVVMDPNSDIEQLISSYDATVPGQAALPVNNYYRSLDDAEARKYKQILIDIRFNTMHSYNNYPNLAKLATGRHKNYVWDRYTGHDDASNKTGAGSNIVFPVTEYGSEVTQNMVATIKLMLKYTQEGLADATKELYEAHKDILKVTARGSQASEHDPDSPPLQALKEGIVSYGDALSMLIAQKPKGFENFEDVLSALNNGRAVNQLAHIMPMGVIRPLDLNGWFFKEIIDSRGDKLVLKPEFEHETIKPLVEEYLKNHVHRKPRTPEEFEQDIYHGFGCPVALKGKEYKKSGIDALGEVFEQVYKIVSKVAEKKKEE